MIEIFIYVFIYLAVIVFIAELFDLSDHANEKASERFLILFLLFLWPITGLFILIFGTIAVIYKQLKG